MAYEAIIVERNEGIVTITMNRPQRKNAANATMWNELKDAFQSVSVHTGDRVVVLTGAEGNFCSGADVSGDADGSERPHQLFSMDHIGDVATALKRIPVPVIAKIRGVAVGAGLNMALLCDMSVASDNARFSEIFARRGLTIDFGGSWILPRRVGLHRAKELALLAEIIDATEADRIGLVNRVVADADLDAFVDDWATKLAAGPPIALTQTKRLLNASAESSLEQALEGEGFAQTINFTTQDTAEAMSAFQQKRDPKFQGR